MDGEVHNACVKHPDAACCMPEYTHSHDVVVLADSYKDPHSNLISISH